MLNKKSKWLLWGSMVLCCGCVDNAYDLNKDIVMDVTIAGNKITLPVGNVKPIVLDSLINVDDIDLLEKMNGVYSLKKSDVIDPIDIEIDPIKINIDPITHSSTFQFDEVTIDEAVLNEVRKEQTFGVNEVSIEDLNESLPTLAKEVTTGVLSPELEEQLLALKGTGIAQEITTPFAYTVNTGVQKVKFGLSYKLPKEIKEITDITLNNLIKFRVTNPAIFAGANKTISFDATVPEGFVLRKDENAPHADKYTVDGRTVKVSGVDSQGDEVFVQFYIEALTGLGNRIVDGAISFDEEIEYEVEYTVDGNVTLSNNTELTDFDFLVAMDHKVSFEDAKGSTNDINVDFETMELDFSAHFDNLEHIKKVEYIEFDAANSKINFKTDLGDGGFAPFNLKEGCQLKLSFPDKFVLDLGQCVYPEGVTYNEEEHAFLISDVNVLNGFEWQLAIDRVDVYTEVVNKKCDLEAPASISVVSPSENDVLKLGATVVESFNSTLEKLKSKDVVFTMGETHLHIDDAVVMTETIHEEIDEHTSLSVNEKIDEGVKRIESIEFVGGEVPITLNVGMTGVEDIDTDIHLKLDVELPSFLVLDKSDEELGVTINNGMLTIEKDYNPKEGNLTVKLLGKKLDFEKEYGEGGVELEKADDNSYYLKYEKDIPISGEAYINETEMHSTILGKDVGINVDFTIGEMEVKKFSGIYCGKIDDINESIELDLGEDLDFLKEDGNTVTLSDPQIMFTIDNPVSVPVDMALSLFGKDDNGQIIETSRVETVIRLEPAVYDEVTGNITTRDMKFLLTNKEVELDGYTTVFVPDLSNLLKRIPNTLDIELKPTIDESVTHHVDLSKDLVFHPEYDVVVPLKFDNIHIEYTELVEDLNKDLGEALEHFANIELKVDMNIRNTVPVGLVLTVEPLDTYGNLIEDVEVENVQIAAGNGDEINGADAEGDSGEKLQLIVKSKGDVLRRLDKLNLLIKADADETVGGEALTPKQGVHITNIVLEVKGDVDTNLDEL